MLSVIEEKTLKSLRVNVIDANKLEEKTSDRAECDKWIREQKLRFTASNFGKTSLQKIFWLKKQSLQQLQWSMAKSMNEWH